MSLNDLLFRWNSDTKEFSLAFIDENGKNIQSVLSPAQRIEILLDITLDTTMSISSLFKAGCYSARTNTEISFDEDQSDDLGNILCIRRQGQQKQLLSPGWSVFLKEVAQEIATLRTQILRQEVLPVPPYFSRERVIERLIEENARLKKQIQKLQQNLSAKAKKPKQKETTTKTTRHQNSSKVMKNHSHSPTMTVGRENDDLRCLLKELLAEILSQRR